MNYNQLKYVISLAENGSFSRAAKELYITQPSLSNQIKALEEELGTPLFIRMHHNIKLTEAGYDFVMYSRRILNEMDGLQNLMSSYSSFSRGHLTIGAFSNAGYIGILEHIVTFQKLYPKIKTNIIMEHSDRLTDLLMTQEIDIAFLASNETILRDSDFQYAQLTEEPFVAIIPPEHPLSNRTSIQISDLQNERLILSQEGSHIRSMIISALNKTEAELDLCGQCNSTVACAQMVNTGFGISIILNSVARSLKSYNFRIIPLIPPVRLHTYLAMLKTTYPGSIADELFHYLQTQFR